jgi:hypothetical protein
MAVRREPYRTQPVRGRDALWALKLSTYPFSQGLPGAMYAVLAPTAAIHPCTASATNSGPLSERMCPGTPCRKNRSDWGQHHHISGKYLGAYARERAWREDTRRKHNGALHTLAAGAALGHPVSRMWKGYWQRALRS